MRLLAEQWTEPAEALKCSMCSYLTDIHPSRCLCDPHYDQFLRLNLTRFQYRIWKLNQKLGLKGTMRNYYKYKFISKINP